MTHYYLGQWAWEEEVRNDLPFRWVMPRADIGMGSLDLRSLPQCATPGPVQQGYGVFALSELVRGVGEYLGEGGTLPAWVKDTVAFTLELGERIVADELPDVLWELMTLHCDPLGAVRWKPLIPESGRRLRLRFGGLDVARVVGPADIEWPSIRTVVQEDYRGLRQFAETLQEPYRTRAIETALRFLSTLERKYQVDYREFIPSDMLDEGTLTPRTSISDNFNTGDSDTIGATLTFTEVVGDFDNASNACAYQTDDGGFGSARAESDLSTVDHSAQVDIITITRSGGNAANAGPAARFSPSANTRYFALGLDGGSGSADLRFYKAITGTNTEIQGAVTPAISLPDTLKITVAGSSMRSYWNGVVQHSFTDSSITGNVRCGLFQRIPSALSPGDSVLDNFAAQDIGAGALVNGGLVNRGLVNAGLVD